MYRYFTIIVVLLALIVGGCVGDDHAHEATAENEPPSRAVTLWTDKMELFMEFPLLTVNSSARFIVHLTTVDDFQPVRSGEIRLEF